MVIQKLLVVVELVANKIRFDFSSNINCTSGDIHLPITDIKKNVESVKSRNF